MSFSNQQSKDRLNNFLKTKSNVTIGDITVKVAFFCDPGRNIRRKLNEVSTNGEFSLKSTGCCDEDDSKTRNLLNTILCDLSDQKKAWDCYGLEIFGVRWVTNMVNFFRMIPKDSLGE